MVWQRGRRGTRVEKKALVVLLFEVEAPAKHGAVWLDRKVS